MIFQFRIISDENKDFAREILLDGNHTFLDFHNALQENLGYDPSQLSSFFLTNEDWEKTLQITLIDMMDDSNDTTITMDLAKLSDHIEEKGQRLLYVFDFFSERAFFIEVIDILENLESKVLPKINFEHGDPPAQIDLGIEGLLTSEEDFGSDDIDGYDEDEIGEGFEYTNGDDFPDE